MRVRIVNFIVEFKCYTLNCVPQQRDLLLCQVQVRPRLKSPLLVGVLVQKRETETERRHHDPTTICRNFDLSHIRRPARMPRQTLTWYHITCADQRLEMASASNITTKCTSLQWWHPGWGASFKNNSSDSRDLFQRMELTSILAFLSIPFVCFFYTVPDRDTSWEKESLFMSNINNMTL